MLHPTLRMGLVALAAIGIAGAAANAQTGNAAPAAHELACGVSTQTQGNLLSIEGVLQSPTALSGQYRFALKSQGAGGSTNVSQGGQFTAAPGALVSLGKVMVNAGASLDIDFTVTAGGKQLDCSTPLATLT